MDVDADDERPVLTILEVESYLDKLRRYTVAKLGIFQLTHAT
jgi:hypothetical protein